MSTIVRAELRLLMVSVGVLLLGLVAFATEATPEVSASDAAAAISSSGEASVPVDAEEVASGLGAWTIDITYDQSVVSVGDCMDDSGSSCSAAYGAGTVRVTGSTLGQSVLVDAQEQSNDGEQRTTGSRNDGSGLVLLIAVLALALIAGIVGFGALRIRPKA